MAEIFENTKFCLENRKRLSLTGVTSVDGFSEKQLNLTLSKDKLKILGENIKITAYNKASGNLSADGTFIEFRFSGANKSIMRKIFK